MKKGILLILFFLPFLFFGCKSAQGAKASFTDLNGDWNVVEINNKKVVPEVSTQVMIFDVSAKRISGHSGCNRFSGAIEYTDTHKNIIKFLQVASTRMACPDMEGEMEMLEAINKIVRFEALEKGKPVQSIALYGTDGSRLMVIGKR